MRLATYNVHGCVGGDGRFDPERVLRVLEQLDADVIALQEVLSGDGPDDPMGLFARRLGCTAVPGPTMQRGDGLFGNVLLTRWPVTAMDRLDLSLPGREPRGAIDARLDGGGESIRVIATHLGLRAAERRRQVRRLVDHVRTHVEADAPSGLLALLGDVNEWLLWGRPLRYLHRTFDRAPARRSYPSYWPCLALDRVWVHPARRLRGVSVFRRRPARMASDHLPVVAVVEASE